VLGDRGCAVATAVADGDAARPRRIEIDVVGAGRRDQDQFQRRSGIERFGAQQRLVGDDDLTAGQTLHHRFDRGMAVLGQFDE